MVNSEELNQIRQQIDDLAKKAAELEDTLVKEDLSKNRFRHIDYGSTEYWIKVLNIEEEGSDCIMVNSIDKSWQLSRHYESNLWLGHTDSITESEFMSKYNDVYQLIKC